jgi:hypothetical protein
LFAAKKVGAKTALENFKDFPGPANLSRKSVDLNSKGMYT